MDENLKTMLGILLGMVLIFLVFLAVAGNIYPGGFETLGFAPESEYNYEVTLTTSETLYNLTMFVPLPSYSGNSPVGLEILAGNAYGIPGDMEVDLFGDRDSASLKITIPETDGFRFGTNTAAGGVIDTKNPVEGSYVLSPVYDLKSGIDTDSYKTYLYASFEASLGANVKVDIMENGINRWQVFSAKENSFDGFASYTMTGSPGKWEAADVILNKGQGDYSILF